MGPQKRDWMSVVYGANLDPAGSGSESAAPSVAVEVRHSPSELDPSTVPGGAQRIRVTVVPSAPVLGWSLYLHDLSRRRGGGPATQVWWRVEPGTWQPLAGTGSCVAKGRGRTLLDVELRVNPDLPAGAGRPSLRFVVKPSWGGRRPA